MHCLPGRLKSRQIGSLFLSQSFSDVTMVTSGRYAGPVSTMAMATADKAGWRLDRVSGQSRLNCGRICGLDTTYKSNKDNSNFDRDVSD